jgi:hypothetical protein
VLDHQDLAVAVGQHRASGDVAAEFLTGAQLSLLVEQREHRDEIDLVLGVCVEVVLDRLADVPVGDRHEGGLSVSCVSG